MNGDAPQSGHRDRAVLLYRSTCPRCRFLSALVVLLSGRAIRRVPNHTEEAAALYARHQRGAGKLALFNGRRAYWDRAVYSSAWKVILWCWIGRIPLLGGVLLQSRRSGNAA